MLLSSIPYSCLSSIVLGRFEQVEGLRLLIDDDEYFL
jgi:hypothetical protein